MKNSLLILIVAFIALSLVSFNEVRSQESVTLSAEFDPNYPNQHNEWRYFLEAQALEGGEPFTLPSGTHFEWYYDEDGGTLQHFASTTSPSTSLDDNLDDHGYVYVLWYYNSTLMATSNSVFVCNEDAWRIASNDHPKPEKHTTLPRNSLMLEFVQAKTK